MNYLCGFTIIVSSYKRLTYVCAAFAFRFHTLHTINEIYIYLIITDYNRLNQEEARELYHYLLYIGGCMAFKIQLTP